MAETATALSQILAVILVLTIVTNIIVEVLKSVLGRSVPWNLLAMVVALVVTGLAFIAVVTYYEIQVKVWMVIGVIALAFAVAFAAMYGFDKLKEMIAQWAALNNKDGSDHSG